MIVGIHQPNYLPWIGYFTKIARCDVFILLDDVQYIRRGFINRNRIKTARGIDWLTVPVQVKGRYTAAIDEIVPCWDSPWAKDHLRTLEVNYGRAPYYAEVMEEVVAPVLTEAASVQPRLSVLNAALIARVCAYLGIDTPMIEASSFSVESASTQRLIDLVRCVGGTAYLSGHGGDNYQKAPPFAAAGIELLYNDFDHPRYEQLWEPFEPNLSVIDYLMCRGRSAGETFSSRSERTRELVSQRP